MNPRDASKQILENLPFNAHIGLEVLDASTNGRAVARLPDRDEVKNHVGTQHAGALFTIGETAAGAAIIGAFGHLLGEMTPLARGGEISYRRPALGPITAKAQLREKPDDVVANLRSGAKTECVVDVSLEDEQGTVVAAMNVRWFFKPNA